MLHKDSQEKATVLHSTPFQYKPASVPHNSHKSFLQSAEDTVQESKEEG